MEELCICLFALHIIITITTTALAFCLAFTIQPFDSIAWRKTEEMCICKEKKKDETVYRDRFNTIET